MRDLSAKTWDYIIVGAGSAGCVLADRLSRSGRDSVLVLEAGPLDRSLMMEVPRGLGKTVSPTSPFLSWYEIAKTPAGESERWLKGRVVGGSSSINGMIDVRGHPADYDDWEAAGCPGWGWNEIGRCFVEMEDHQLGPGEARGIGGPLRVTIQSSRTVLTKALIKAGAELGLPFLDDLNGASATGGIGYAAQTIGGGRRMSASRAFLRPALSRPKVQLVADASVLRVQCESGKAAGVIVRMRDGSELLMRAGREVILSAGAIETPRLLQLSGIGDPVHLSSLGIQAVAAAPDVGRNLHEHYNLALTYRVNAGGVARELRGARLAWNAARWMLTRGGPLANSAHELIALAPSAAETQRYDMLLGFTLFSWDAVGNSLLLRPGDSLMVHNYYTRPTSRGYCRITAPSFDTPFEIVANYLDTENDRRHSLAGTRLARRFMEQPALAPFAPEYVGPDINFDSDDELLALFEERGMSAFHVVGTCRMGSDPASVVDPQLRLRGIAGLRVVDASVMPSVTSGNTNGPVMALAWRAAELIKATTA